MTIERNNFIQLIVDIIKMIGRYIRGHIIIAAFNGLIAALGFILLDLPYAWLLGVVVLFTSLIPFIGSIIGFIPALIVAWFTFHTGWSLLWVGLIWMVTQLLELFVFQPWIFGQQLELNPILVLVALLISSLLFGFIGMIIAVPLLAIIQLIIRRFKKSTSS